MHTVFLGLLYNTGIKNMEWQLVAYLHVSKNNVHPQWRRENDKEMKKKK
jgi:hypothetical protein